MLVGRHEGRPLTEQPDAVGRNRHVLGAGARRDVDLRLKSTASADALAAQPRARRPIARRCGYGGAHGECAIQAVQLQHGGVRPSDLLDDPQELNSRLDCMSPSRGRPADRQQIRQVLAPGCAHGAVPASRL